MHVRSAHLALTLLLCLGLAASRAGSVSERARSDPSPKEQESVDAVMVAAWAVESGEYRVESLRDLAVLWKALKRFDQALHMLGPVRNSDQAGGEDFFQTGYMLHRLGCHEPALDAYWQALVMDPSHPEAHYNLALLLQRIGDVDGAVHHFEEVLRMRPAYEPTYFDLTVLFLTADRVHDAEGILKRYLAAGTDSLALKEASEILRDLMDDDEPGTSR